MLGRLQDFEVQIKGLLCMIKVVGSKKQQSYLWLIDLALNIDLGLTHWRCVEGCLAEALVLQDPDTKYKTGDTL